MYLLTYLLTSSATPTWLPETESPGQFLYRVTDPRSHLGDQAPMLVREQAETDTVWEVTVCVLSRAYVV